MKTKPPAEPTIYDPGKETNAQKNVPGGAAMAQGTSLLKKNEFTMILVAALVVTALVFFFFFTGPSTNESNKSGTVSTQGQAPVVPGFEDRISALEISLAKIASASEQSETQAASRAVSDLDERMTRVESAVNLKLDTLIERVNKLEGRLSNLAVAPPTPAPKPVVKPKPEIKKKATVQVTPPVPEKKVQVVKKKVQTSKPQKTSQFHTVQKGETLWSISQKYKTNVATIRRLNNLTPEDKIYVGTNLLVK